MDLSKTVDTLVSESMSGLVDESGNPRLENGDFIGDDGMIHCGTCKGRKQTSVELLGRIVHPRVMCECEKKAEAEQKKKQVEQRQIEKIERLRSMSLMDDKLRASTFESYKDNGHNAIALRVCTRYVDAFDEMCERNRGLLFYGEPGTGKTFAAACIANRLIERGVPVIMTSFVKLLASSKFGNEDESIINSLNAASLLIIDDLGAERGSDFALERVYNVVDSRYRARKPVILTTNLTIGEMQAASDKRYTRIYDRVFEMCALPLKFDGPSWRKVVAAQGFEDMRKLMEE